MDQHTRNLICAALVHDADTYELETPHGVLTLTLRIDVDPDTTPADYPDVYGTFHYALNNADTGRDQRPAECDGAARKIWTSRSYWMWWQPPADVVKMPDALRSLATTVRELWETGFALVAVTVDETITDRLGHEHTVCTGSASLGAVEGADDAGYLADIVVGLLDELEGTGVLP